MNIKKKRLSLLLRRYFFTGILVTAPVGLTLYITWVVIAWIDDLVTPYLPDWLNPRRMRELPRSQPAESAASRLTNKTIAA